jgi:hypothetical protein
MLAGGYAFWRRQSNIDAGLSDQAVDFLLARCIATRQTRASSTYGVGSSGRRCLSLSSALMPGQGSAASI